MKHVASSHFSPSEIKERARRRRARMVGNRAASFQDADEWDLDFWQKAGPEARLSALVALRREVDVVNAAKKAGDGHG